MNYNERRTVNILGTGGAFNMTSYTINPANSRSFPFLAQLAANYEQYEVEGMLYQFRSTSANALNSTNTALGSVIMATQYDVLDAPFASKTEMLNYEFSTSAKPSENVIHMIECEPRQTSVSELFTLTGSVPTGADPRLYHLGRFSIATVGFQADNVNIGELHVTYQVRLLKPKLYTSLGLFNGMYVENQNTGTSAVYSNTFPLGTAAPTQPVTNTLGITIDRNLREIYFPVNNAVLFYRVEIFWIGTAAAVVYPALTNSSNLAITSLGSSPSAATSTTSCGYFLGVTVTGTSTTPVLKFGTGGTLPTGNNQLIIRIWQVSFTG